MHLASIHGCSRPPYPAAMLRRPAATLVGVAIIAAGCGGGADEADPSPTAAPTAFSGVFGAGSGSGLGAAASPKIAP